MNVQCMSVQFDNTIEYEITCSTNIYTYVLFFEKNKICKQIKIQLCVCVDILYVSAAHAFYYV